jgi:hypothetical protein
MGWFGTTTIEEKEAECNKCTEDLATMKAKATQKPAATTVTPQTQANGESPKKGFFGLWGGKRKSRRRRRNNRKSRKSRRTGRR